MGSIDLTPKQPEEELEPELRVARLFLATEEFLSFLSKENEELKKALSPEEFREYNLGLMYIFANMPSSDEGPIDG